MLIWGCFSIDFSMGAYGSELLKSIRRPPYQWKAPISIIMRWPDEKASGTDFRAYLIEFILVGTAKLVNLNFFLTHPVIGVELWGHPHPNRDPSISKARDWFWSIFDKIHIRLAMVYILPRLIKQGYSVAMTYMCKGRHGRFVLLATGESERVKMPPIFVSTLKLLFRQTHPNLEMGEGIWKRFQLKAKIRFTLLWVKKQIKYSSWSWGGRSSCRGDLEG